MNKKKRIYITLLFVFIILFSLVIVFKLVKTEKKKETVNFSEIIGENNSEIVISNIKFNNIKIHKEIEKLSFDITNEGLETIMLNKIKLKFLDKDSKVVCQSDFSLNMKMPNNRTLEGVSVNLLGDCKNAYTIEFELLDFEIIVE